MHVYLFEAKSIQSYLFRSGKLKDVISASERLDRLVDDTDYSTLARVLEAAGLQSNLLDAEIPATGETIGFIRCKGGAFYAFCEKLQPLATLRSLWTLTVQQLFPGLEFADTLTEGDNLSAAMASAHPLLAATRNTPPVRFPLSSAACAHAPRTGLAAVPLSAAAKKEAGIKDDNAPIDLDTEHHRQAYRLLKLRQHTLIGKFTGAGQSDSELPEDLNFPLDFEDFPAFNNAQDTRAAVKDLALIHIDGNGLGLLLRGLQQALNNCSDQDYSLAFRQFSAALATATQQAAYHATCWLYKQQKNTNRASGMLAMRPIVLGGDDVTLFCQADLALEYAEQFCRQFKTCSKQALAPLYKRYLSKTDLKPYLTASGGILYHKAAHPFTVCHQLVEDLCQEAKKTTKAVDTNTGPAALSFYRLSHALAEDIATVRTQSQHFRFENESKLISSLGGYLVDKQDNNKVPSLPQLRSMFNLLNQPQNGKPLPLSIAKFRQMATELAQGDPEEAERIYHRACDQLQRTSLAKWKEWQSLLENLNQQGDQAEWRWATSSQGNEHQQTWLSDLLIHAHFQPAIQGATA